MANTYIQKLCVPSSATKQRCWVFGSSKICVIHHAQPTTCLMLERLVAVVSCIEVKEKGNEIIAAGGNVHTCTKATKS